ncbi:MAG TPA: ATP-binding protein [Alphaproteobacteria bacterium]|nr:ATP-binding protein [Alphaproteobacteria bacterium]
MAATIVRNSALGWTSLVGAVERLSAAESIDGIIEVVRETARAISGADGVSFVLRDGDRCHYVEENAVGPLWKGRRFPMSACISGWCMLNRQIAVIPDIFEDPRIPHDAYRPTFVKSLVMVPVGKDQPLAAIGFYWGVARAFGDGEVALLEGLGRSTSAAIAAVQAHASLRENEERLRLALDAGKLGAWELDLATGELTASNACKAHFGRAPGERLCFEDVLSATHDADAPMQQEAFANAVQSGAKLQIEFRAVWPNQETHWIDMRGQAVLDESTLPYKLAGVTLDLTEQREAEDRVAELQSELAHVSRLTELGQMSSAFAHELVQPLAAAHNYLTVADRMVANHASVTQVRELVGKAATQFDRSMVIVDRIHGFGRKGKITRTIEQISQLVDDATEIALINPKYREVRIEKGIGEDLPCVHVDRIQIQQVLLNLLRNAFEALESASSPQLSISAAPDADGKMIELRVEDNGPGLDPAVAGDLFKPFVTTKPHGMGVGLSICRDIIESHGGKMWAGTANARGAAFCLTLPVAQAS